MDNDRPEQSRKRHRLLGEVDGRVLSLPLVPGDNRLGSADDNHLVLHERGVSRYHARLWETPEGWLVEDLESKNGTTVNGKVVGRERVAVGDELSFGPVVMRLEEIDPDDAELGMVVGGEQTPAPEVLRETTRLTQSGGLSRLGGLRWMDAFLGHLMVRPHGNLEGALGLVVQALEGAGAALVDWHREAPPIVAAAGGKVGELPSAARVLASAEAADGPFYVTVPGAPAVTAVVRPQGAEASGLVVWGGTPERSSWEPLLGLLLRLIDRFRPRSVSPLQEPPPAAGDELRFPPGIVRGEAPAMVALYQEMSSLLQGDVPVLIAGETGVGKEHLAAALHASSRRRGAFVAVNCAAIPAELLEAEMFGIGKGVATGVEARIGKFVEADGGTLLLDEIGDMPKPLQGKLLRALQEKQIHPLGRPAAVVDVRVISATNTDLEAGIREGRFRQDLYYRIAGYVLRVPALRHRCEDIPRLIGHFTRAYCRETGKSVRGITVKALRALTEYAWPGNVRQLDHEIRRLVYLCPHGQAVDSGLLSDPILRPPPAVELLRNEADSGSLNLEAHLEAVERRLIRRALDQTQGNQTRAAKLLGVSRNGLAKRLKRLGIKPLAVTGCY